MAFVGTLILDGQKLFGWSNGKKWFQLTKICLTLPTIVLHAQRSARTTVEVSIFFPHTVFANGAFRSAVKHVF